MTAALFYIGLGLRIREYPGALPELVVPVPIGSADSLAGEHVSCPYGERFLGGAK